MKKVLVIHGPNLNLLGRREPEVYGKEGLETINNEISREAKNLDISVDFFQSNSEGEIVDKIQQSAEGFSIIIINPAAYTHTSVAIRDALLAVHLPAIEVHLSNIYKREEFRKKSLISDIVIGQISGFGAYGYILAIRAAAKQIANLG
ncbi:MAG: type II 3-dehydroquinate dehydratase [Proteobacteria bacterium]|nr:type II 3-dehydroquinate dehydratase [Pseudomonadota bacterium]